MKADTPPDQKRLLALETINENYPADQWLQVFTDGSYVESQAGVYSKFASFAAAGQNRSAFEGEIEAVKIALGQLCCQDTKFTNVEEMEKTHLILCPAQQTATETQGYCEARGQPMG
nr:hypothetical transcript [Hymenolepis microstoma]